MKTWSKCVKNGTRGSRGALAGLVGCILLCAPAAEAKLLEVGPITDTILMVWLREGVYNHPIDMSAKYPCCQPATVAWQDDIDIAEISAASSYTIRSTDDGDFALGLNPAEVGRKSKASDCKQSGSAEYFSDHWLYLVLPKKLKRGKTYRLDMGGIASAQTFTYNEFKQRCEAIHVNHYGYPPQSTAKFAYISQFMGDLAGLELENYQGARFHIVKDQGDTPLFTGTINKRKDYKTDGGDTWNFRIKNVYRSYTMADVWECDFTPFQGEPGYAGKYRVVVEGMGCSYPFRIDRGVYLDAWKDAMNGLYHQRCGIICHKKGEQYKETHSTQIDSKGELTGNTYTNVVGGYHDAADCDKYPTHLTVAKELLWAFETRPGIFKDGELDIPEAGNGVPDLLDEAAWVVAYFFRLQTAAGGVRVGSSPAGCSSPDHGDNILFAPDPQHSLDFSSVANQLAHCMKLAGVEKITGPHYEDVDLSRSNLLTKARAAYQWGLARLRPQLADTSSASLRVKTSAYTACAWMYKVTGDKTYEETFKHDNPIRSVTDWLYPMEGETTDSTRPGTILHDMQEPAWVYLTTDHADMDKNYKKVYRGAFNAWYTYDRIDASAKRGMRQSHHWRNPTVVGTQTTPRIIPQALAYFNVLNEKRWLDICYPALDWVLGGNQMNYCWMYNTGYRSPREYHYHGAPPTGLVIYGHAFTMGVSGTNTNSGHASFSVTTLYPPYRLWGQMELYVENRVPCLTNEFTVHQTQSAMCAGLAILKDGGPDGLPLGNVAPESTGAPSSDVSSVPSLSRTPGHLVIKFHDSGGQVRSVNLVSVGGRRAFSCTAALSAVEIPVKDIAAGCYYLTITGGGVQRSVTPLVVK